MRRRASEAEQGATFKVFPAATLEGMVKSLEESPAAKDIVTGKRGRLDHDQRGGEEGREGV